MTRPDGMHLGQDPDEAAYLERREQKRATDARLCSREGHQDFGTCSKCGATYERGATVQATSTRVTIARAVKAGPGEWYSVAPDGRTLAKWGDEGCAVAFAAGWNMAHREAGRE